MTRWCGYGSPPKYTDGDWSLGLSPLKTGPTIAFDLVVLALMFWLANL